MLASVVQLRPRAGSFERALAAFRSASIKVCLSELSGLQTPAASHLRARANLRIGSPDDALQALCSPEFTDSRGRGEAALLLAVARQRLGDADAAEAALSDAAVFSISAADPALAAEVDFFRGLFALGRGDLDAAKASLQNGLETTGQPWPASLKSGFVPHSHVIARIQELLGIVSVANGDYMEQLEFVRASLETLDSCAIKDAFQESFVLRNLAILARDFDVNDDSERLGIRIASFPYTAEIGAVCFTTREALAWCSALRGDVLNALRHLRSAESSASIVPERVILGIDRALLAREAGHQQMVTEEIENAIELSESFDWNEAAGDSRDALLVLAQSAAHLFPNKARRALDRYSAITRSMDITYAARIEPRARAEEDYTHGVVLRSEGRLGASMERLESAFKTWDSIGYAWRAGRAALELAELGAGEVFRLAVRRELHRRPESPFAKRARLVA